MAKTKQFTIAVDNRPGAVAHIAKTLGGAKVNILALVGTTQGSAGTVQLVVEDPKKAKKALDAAGVSYRENAAEAQELANKPGALAAQLEKLAAKGVNLSSICATAGKGSKKVVVVYAVQEQAQAAVPPAALAASH
jgi:hypothetical protein